MVSKALFSSDTGEWETPQWLFDEIDKLWHFELDVAASRNNFKCMSYITKEDDAFKTPWDGVWWCNPPYGRDLGKWINRAWESEFPGVMLLPSRTDTKWFHYGLDLGGIVFINGRLTFGGAKNNAPFPSLIAQFRADSGPWNISARGK